MLQLVEKTRSSVWLPTRVGVLTCLDMFKEAMVSRNSKPINSKGNQPWVLTGRLRLQYLDQLMRREDSLEKTQMLWKCEGKRKTTEDEMVGQCHRRYQHEFDQTLGGSGRQEGLACSGPWGHEESDMTKWLNNNKAHLCPGKAFGNLEMPHGSLW